MRDVYKNIEDYNLGRERKILIVFDDMIADMINNKKLNPIVTELFVRGRKLNISIVFITQSYFKVPKGVRLNSTHFFIMKILNKRELQQIALNHSSDIDFKDFMKMKFEKLQYDVNREAEKISALSSGEFNKYEYATGEEILPSNKQQIIEQAKFTYSPLGKVFEKHLKTIEYQGEKQIKAIQDNRKQLISNDDYKNKLLISKEREIFKDIYNRRLDKIKELDNKIDYDNLKYVVERSGVE